MVAYPYVAVAFDRHGNQAGRWEGATVRGLMHTADEKAHPQHRIRVSAAFTSDGTFWGPGKGRIMAYSEGTRGKRREWQIEAYHDAKTEAGGAQRDRRASGRRR